MATNFITYATECREIASRVYGFGAESIKHLNFESDYREGLSPSQAVDRAAVEIGNWFYNHMLNKIASDVK